ncbi:helix-turn-helix transcriptional regulator [Sinomicrobium sp. M5D2P9]
MRYIYKCIYINVLCFLFPATGNGQQYSRSQIDTLLLYQTEALRLDGRYEEAMALNIRAIRMAEEIDYRKGIARGYLYLGILLCESGQPEGEISGYLVKDTWSNDNIRVEKEGFPSIELTKEQGAKYRKVTPQLHYISWGIMILCIVILLLVLIYYEKRKSKNTQLILEKDMLIQQKEMESEELRKKLNVAFGEVVGLAKENAPSFLTRFQEVYPEVCTKLLDINPKLVNTELNLCAMVWLNFSSKEIARYTFVQPKTVQIKKYRLRKKLNVPSDEDLYSWIRNL